MEELYNKILKTMNGKKLYFGNKISIAKIKILNAIDDIINNEENFIICDICGEKYSISEISLDFEVTGDKICQNCIDNYYTYCNECGKPIYTEGQDYHIIDDDLYCEDCFFEVKEDLIKNTDLIDKKLIALNRLLKIKKLKVNYDNLKDYSFKIDKHDFNVEVYGDGYIRLGSWGANYWVDLCNNESYILKAIQYLLKDKKIMKIIKHE